MRLLLTSIAGALIGGAALAQPTTPPIPVYQVEIIVFAHRDFDAGEEHFPQALTPLRADHDDALPEAPPFAESSPPSVGGETAAAPLEPPQEPVEDPLAIRLLTPEELQLNSEYRKVTNLAAYRAVLHAGWVQPGLPEDQATPFDLSLLGVTNPRGTVVVYLSRFLHVKLDISYENGATDPARATEPAGNELREVALAPRYRLTAERQMRSGELHYFDHPAFGVLVKVTPVQPANSGSTGRRPAA